MLYLPGTTIWFRLTAAPTGWNVSAPPQPDWLEAKLRTCNVPPGSLTDVMAQLNRGQSAEVVSADGNLLRLWTDPRQQKHGVEFLDDASAPAPPADGILDLGELAARHLEHRLGPAGNADERAVLVEALVRQWQYYQGQACLFVGDIQLVLVRKIDRFGGGFYVASTQVPFPITRGWPTWGLRPKQSRTCAAGSTSVRRSGIGRPTASRGSCGTMSRNVACAAGPWSRARRPPAAVRTAPRPRAGRPCHWAGSKSSRGRLPRWPRRARRSPPTCAGTPRATAAIWMTGPAAAATICVERDLLRSIYYTAQGAMLSVSTLADRSCTVVSHLDPRRSAELVRAVLAARSDG